MLKKIIKALGWLFGSLILLLTGVVIYLLALPQATPPLPSSRVSERGNVVEVDHGLFKIGNNWFRKSKSGLYELYVEGGPFERGVANGKLTRVLIQHQEEVFTKQIHRLVPSAFYLGALSYLVKWYNRNLAQNIPEEYQLEIYGVSEAASPAFESIGTPYQRILNYHAAHDIGHALQNISLVGCTSFATWGSRSEDNTLIVGRNFDFYLGDDFARDKIVAFYNPKQGYKFMMVTFGGMTGVLSGMNNQGLTVTLNAAKSEFPPSSATPVSIVAREILQYASTLREAYAIAKKRQMFVAESILIGSANDGKAAIIEKTPEGIDFFETGENYIICTNHFQGHPLGDTQLNKEHMKNSASLYRFERVKQLLNDQPKNSIAGTARILRNRQGLDDRDIGLGNEKSINQLIAHHSIIFQPEKLRVWISTAPWQLGKYVCYDLNKVFDLKMSDNHEIDEEELTIPPDPFPLRSAYHSYLKFKTYRFPFDPHTGLQPDSIVSWNPNSYQAHMLAGDFYVEHEEYAKAIPEYEQGLQKEVATVEEREHMEKSLQQCKERIR